MEGGALCAGPDRTGHRPAAGHRHRDRAALPGGPGLCVSVRAAPAPVSGHPGSHGHQCGGFPGPGSRPEVNREGTGKEGCDERPQQKAHAVRQDRRQGPHGPGQDEGGPCHGDRHHPAVPQLHPERDPFGGQVPPGDHHGPRARPGGGRPGGRGMTREGRDRCAGCVHHTGGGRSL